MAIFTTTVTMLLVTSVTITFLVSAIVIDIAPPLKSCLPLKDPKAAS